MPILLGAPGSWWRAQLSLSGVLQIREVWGWSDADILEATCGWRELGEAGGQREGGSCFQVMAQIWGLVSVDTR